ncbi:NADH dehydrogenase subunit D, partial [Streptomyces sp. SID10244]|nr:NADH dehydrogenase subunit D [Streptomyces sp. SID10244]
MTTTDHGNTGSHRSADVHPTQTYTVSGQDWDEIVTAVRERAAEQPGDERIVVNMGPQHP